MSGTDSGLEQAFVPAKVHRVTTSAIRYDYPGVLAQVNKWIACLNSSWEK